MPTRRKPPNSTCRLGRVARSWPMPTGVGGGSGDLDRRNATPSDPHSREHPRRGLRDRSARCAFLGHVCGYCTVMQCGIGQLRGIWRQCRSAQGLPAAPPVRRNVPSGTLRVESPCGGLTPQNVGRVPRCRRVYEFSMVGIDSHSARRWGERPPSSHRGRYGLCGSMGQRTRCYHRLVLATSGSVTGSRLAIQPLPIP